MPENGVTQRTAKSSTVTGQSSIVGMEKIWLQMKVSTVQLFLPLLFISVSFFRAVTSNVSASHPSALFMLLVQHG